jgi:hypothetical protein
VCCMVWGIWQAYGLNLIHNVFGQGDQIIILLQWSTVYIFSKYTFAVFCISLVLTFIYSMYKSIVAKLIALHMAYHTKQRQKLRSLLPFNIHNSESIQKRAVDASENLYSVYHM